MTGRARAHLALAIALLAAPAVRADATDAARRGEASPGGQRSTPAQSLAVRAARFAPVESARAEFTQEREVSLVEEVLHARGTLALRAPDSMRLELLEPEHLTILASGKTISALDAEGAPLPLPAEVSGFAHFARALNELMFGRRAPERFTERWTGPDTVTLVPEDASAPFAEISLRFSPDKPLPEEIVLRERTGDRTTIRLKILEIETRKPSA